MLLQLLLQSVNVALLLLQLLLQSVKVTLLLLQLLLQSVKVALLLQQLLQSVNATLYAVTIITAKCEYGFT